jgi:hypothetical protein
MSGKLPDYVVNERHFTVTVREVPIRYPEPKPGEFNKIYQVGPISLGSKSFAGLQAGNVDPDMVMAGRGIFGMICDTMKMLLSCGREVEGAKLHITEDMEPALLVYAYVCRNLESPDRALLPSMLGMQVVWGAADFRIETVSGHGTKE